MLGNCIGKGAFGSVWRGLQDTGTTVAVKQINLSDIPSAELDNIMVRVCFVLKKITTTTTQKKGTPLQLTLFSFSCYAPNDDK